MNEVVTKEIVNRTLIPLFCVEFHQYIYNSIFSMGAFI